MMATERLRQLTFFEHVMRMAHKSLKRQMKMEVHGCPHPGGHCTAVGR